MRNGLSIEEPFDLHCGVVDRGEGSLHVDGLALDQMVLVPQWAAEVGLLDHQGVLRQPVGGLLLQPGDLGHGLRVLRLYNEVALGWKTEYDFCYRLNVCGKNPFDNPSEFLHTTRYAKK